MSDVPLINGDAALNDALDQIPAQWLDDGENITRIYDLNQDRFRLEMELKPGVKIAHRVRKPILEQLIARESATVYEQEEISAGEDTIRIDDEKANATLWDKIALQIQGYKTGSYTADQWIDVTPEIAAKVPATHKATAIRVMYDLKCSLEETEDDGFNLDGETYAIKQEMAGGYTIIHTMRSPTEGQRQEYRRKASQAVFVRGSRKAKAKIVTNLRAYVELYDKLFAAIDGVNLEGFQINQIDPLWKRQVIVELMKVYEVHLSD